jgi:hypothetical protein
VLTEQAIDCSKGNMRGINPLNLLAVYCRYFCTARRITRLPRRERTSGKTGSRKSLYRAALVISMEEVLTVNLGRPTTLSTVAMTPKMTKIAMIMPFLVLLSSRTLGHSRSGASVSRQVSTVCGSCCSCGGESGVTRAEEWCSIPVPAAELMVSKF